MNEPLVLVDRDTAGLAVVTLNRPQAMNALSVGLMAELTHCIDGLAADPTARVLLLTGAGRAFCAGLDLKELVPVRARWGAATAARRARTRLPRWNDLPGRSSAPSTGRR